LRARWSARTRPVEDIMHRLGATAEQIDRERDRAHQELFK
jgi:hypothetical protein